MKNVKCLTLFILALGAFASCQREEITTAPPPGATFSLTEYNPADDVALQLITAFKDHRADASAKKPFDDQYISEAIWLLEAAANEENADLTLPWDFVVSVPCASAFTNNGLWQGSNYKVTGRDMEEVYFAMQYEVQTILSHYPPHTAHILAIDVEPVNAPPATPPAVFQFDLSVTVVVGIVASGASAIFSCEFKPTDDWEWWNEGSLTKIGNCALGTGPGIDAAMKIEQAIKKCTPVHECKYFTNINSITKIPVSAGLNPSDPIPSDNNFDYILFFQNSGRPNYHSCLNEIEMDFYRDWAIQLGVDLAIPAKVLFTTDLVGAQALPGPPFPDTRSHNINLYYGTCRNSPSPN